MFITQVKIVSNIFKYKQIIFFCSGKYRAPHVQRQIPRDCVFNLTNAPPKLETISHWVLVNLIEYYWIQPSYFLKKATWTSFFRSWQATERNFTLFLMNIVDVRVLCVCKRSKLFGLWGLLVPTIHYIRPALLDILSFREKNLFLPKKKNLLFPKVLTFLKKITEHSAIYWCFHASFARV